MIQRSIARTGMMKGESRGEEEVEVMKSKTQHDSLHDTPEGSPPTTKVRPRREWRCYGWALARRRCA